MSRKRKAPKRKHYPDPKYKSLTVSKFINAIMYDGKRSSAEKILSRKPLESADLVLVIHFNPSKGSSSTENRLIIQYLDSGN